MNRNSNSNSQQVPIANVQSCPIIFWNKQHKYLKLKSIKGFTVFISNPKEINLIMCRHVHVQTRREIHTYIWAQIEQLVVLSCVVQIWFSVHSYICQTLLHSKYVPTPTKYEMLKFLSLRSCYHLVNYMIVKKITINVIIQLKNSTFITPAAQFLWKKRHTQQIERMLHEIGINFLQILAVPTSHCKTFYNSHGIM